MAGVYSVVFAHARPAGVGSEELYTVPASRLAIVRDICLYTEAGSSTGLVGVYVLPPGGGDSNPAYIHRVGAAEAGVMYRWTGRQVVEAGGKLLIWVGVEQAVVRVCGYLLAAT